MFSLAHALLSPDSAENSSFRCSPGSSILWRSPTPPKRTRSPCGFGPSQTGLVPFRAEALRRSPGSRACCFSACAGSSTTQDRLIARVYRASAVVPSSIRKRVGVLIFVFRSSITRPTDTPVYASSSRDASRKTRGQDGVAFSFLVGLFHSLQHAGLSRRTPD
jgi:hypothetical protein